MRNGKVTYGDMRKKLREDIKKEIEEKKKNEKKRKMDLEMKRLRFEKLQRGKALLEGDRDE